MLTLSAAAKETGLTKPAIFKAIKNGRVSATKDAKGQWSIDPAELFRVYPPVTKKETAETQTGSFELLLKLKEVETKLEATEKRLLDRNHEIDDLREQRDHWRVQAQQLLLTSNTHRKSFWTRLFG
jgi:hypothetical protein